MCRAPRWKTCSPLLTKQLTRSRETRGQAFAHKFSEIFSFKGYWTET